MNALATFGNIWYPDIHMQWDITLALWGEATSTKGTIQSHYQSNTKGTGASMYMLDADSQKSPAEPVFLDVLPKFSQGHGRVNIPENLQREGVLWTGFKTWILIYACKIGHDWSLFKNKPCQLSQILNS